MLSVWKCVFRQDRQMAIISSNTNHHTTTTTTRPPKRVAFLPKTLEPKSSKKKSLPRTSKPITETDAGPRRTGAAALFGALGPGRDARPGGRQRHRAGPPLCAVRVPLPVRRGAPEVQTARQVTVAYGVRWFVGGGELQLDHVHILQHLLDTGHLCVVYGGLSAAGARRCLAHGFGGLAHTQ